MKTIFAGVFALAAYGLAGAVPAQAHDWAYYNNILFAYAGCYPKDLFTGQGESDSSDGQVFTAAGGAQIIMYGAYSLDDVGPNTLRDEMKSDEAQLLGAAAPKPGLQVLKANSFTFSDYKGDDIVYERTLLRDDAFLTLLITYPKAQRDLYDPLIAPMVKCFVALPPPTVGPNTGK
jgi:hypothetical protein